MRLGRWDVQVINAGMFRLDGGAMFGTVPKVVWEKVMPADDQNRVRFATNCLLLRDGVHAVVVDAGNGDKEDDAFRARFDMGPRGELLAGLAAHGVAPEEVTHALITHLHFDHAGGFTCLDGEAEVPTFPRARHVVQVRELAMAKAPHLRVKASYLRSTWAPLAAAGLFETVEGQVEVLPDLWVRPFPGHVPGLQGIEIRGGGRRLIFPSDLIPTSNHIQPAWVMGYDLDVMTCVDQRVALLEEVSGTEDLLVFQHDPDCPVGRVDQDARGRYRVTAVAE